ncbi:MAG: hypothetical protein ACI8ZH_000712 [Flavobacteriales bacterium]|jgi:hypothetical protein
MKKLLLIVLCFPLFLGAQTLYNPQDLYESPGGLFDKDSLRSVHVNFQNSNYHSILVDSFFTNPTYRIPATITLNGVAYDSVGIRYKGNSTFVLPNNNGNLKLPYNIDMNYWMAGQKLLGKKKVKLANAWMDATFAKEFTASKIYRKYLPTPEVNLAKLYVQNNYLGLYVNTESINKQFVKKHFDEKNGVLFKCDPVQVFGQTTTTNGEPNLNWLGNDSTLYYDSYILKSDKGWAELLQLINTLNNNTAEIDSILNVDRVLWAFAVNTVIANLDTYNGFYIHNYYLYQTKDGLFQMIPWDLSESFGGALLGGVWSTPNDIYHFDPFYGYTTDATTNPLLYKLLDNPQYYLQYTAHLRTMIDESLDTAFIRNSITELQNLGYAAANADVNKPFTIAEYHDNVESALWSWSWFYGFAGILSTIDERKPYLLGHPEIMKIPPSIMNVMVNNNLLTAEVFNGTSVDLMATISEYNSKFQEFEMNDSGQNGDALAGDNIYTAPLPFQASGEELKFYIRAQNDMAMQLNPERAEYEFYTYSSTTSILEATFNKDPILLRITDILGRTITPTQNTPLFYIYSDGSVQKRFIVK